MTDRPAEKPVALLGTIVGVVAIGAMSVVFVISFAAIVYSGPLETFLSRGIGLSLAGASLMALVGGMSFSYRGTICQPQDVTAILLSIGAASIAAAPLGREIMFATVATLVLMATFLTGLAAYAFGRMGLGFLARFIPFPVLAGFLAATGYLLTAGAIGMIVRHPVDLFSVSDLFRDGAWTRWLPWLATAVGVTALTRRLHHPLALPGLLLLVPMGFYGVLFTTGGDLASAANAGMLLGPFSEGGFLKDVDPSFPLHADMRSLIANASTFIAVIGMAILGALLNATGLGLSLKRDVDIDKDLRAVGLSNLAGGIGGGLVGFHLLGETLFASRMGITGRLASVAAAAGCVSALVFGATALSVLPVGLFAVVIAYLGIDLLYQWLWVERRDLPMPDYLLVLLILGAAATVGFLQALTIGLLASAMLFIYSYAQIDTVRLRSTLSNRRSNVERGAETEAVLSEAGETTLIFDLSGYIFFGSASQLGARLRQEIADHPALERIIVDFARVPNLDASAAFGLANLVTHSLTEGVEIWCSGVDPDRQTRFPVRQIEDRGARIFSSLSDALEEAEDQVVGAANVARASGGFLAYLQEQHPQIIPDQVFEPQRLGSGEMLVEAGMKSDALFILLSGGLQAEVPGETGEPMIVARFLPGALVGEIAYYAQAPRSATVRATEPSEVLRIDARALEPGGAAHDLARTVHKLAAGYLARRVMRMNRIVQASGL